MAPNKETMATQSIYSILPDAETFLALEPEELAGVVMEHLNSLPPDEQRHINRYNFGLVHTVRDYPPGRHDDLRQALMEAWAWLEREGLLVPRPGDDGAWVVISRRGHSLQNRADVEAYRQANRLPRRQLHPRLAQKVWAIFLRGDYDVAVFQAFKEVEVRVRDAAQLPDGEIGTDLMRKAFVVDSGPLSDPSAPKAEQEALSHLFAGAIGMYKNPASHRSVTIAAAEAVEMITLASHLLGIVDERANASTSAN